MYFHIWVSTLSSYSVRYHSFPNLNTSGKLEENQNTFELLENDNWFVFVLITFYLGILLVFLYKRNKRILIGLIPLTIINCKWRTIVDIKQCLLQQISWEKFCMRTADIIDENYFLPCCIYTYDGLNGKIYQPCWV